MKRIVLFAMALFALCAGTSVATRADTGCYALVNATPGFVTITFSYLNSSASQNAAVSVRLSPGDTYHICFDSGAGAQAVIGAGMMWGTLSNATLRMGGYPSAVPAGTYTIVPTTRYPAE